MQGISLEQLKLLREQLPLKWRQQGVASSKGVTLIAYIDARDLIDLLDRVCGFFWKDEYKMVGERLMCGISICINGEWVTRWDVGTDSKVEKEKGAVSDAFKRAGVKWCVNLQSYEAEPIRLKTKEYSPGKFFAIDDKGHYFKSKQALNDYCNAINERTRK